MRWLLTMTLLLLLVPPLAAEEIAIIKDVRGEVKIKRAGQLLEAQQSDNLQAGDTLITGKQSTVGVIFHDGSVLSLREKSYLNISDFTFKPLENRFRFKLKLKKGAALFESGKIGVLAPEDFSFEIPEGTIGIRGTKFLVEVR